MTKKWYEFLNITEDQAEFEQIQTEIEQASQLHGSNLWILMCAILVACIGLNMDSTAVIIGAMLISPLMAPLQSLGLGLALYKSGMIREALRTLGFFILASLTASTLYFLLTPLSGSKSELLARTTPTIWDVGIALFGGMAGVIGSTRFTKSNVIPGVAIATALMPPLCTVGFGLATLDIHVISGAFYLFTINAVFITLANLAFWRKMAPKAILLTSYQIDKRTRYGLSLILLVLIIPSIILGYQLVKRIKEEAIIKSFFQSLEQEKELVIWKHEINWDKHIIRIYGEAPQWAETDNVELQRRLNNAGILDFKLSTYIRSQDKLAPQGLDSDALKTFYSLYEKKLEDTDDKLKHLRQELEKSQKRSEKFGSISSELAALLPESESITVGEGLVFHRTAKEDTLPEISPIILIENESKVTEEDKKRIENWLRMRFGENNVELKFIPSATAAHKKGVKQ